MEYIFSSCPAPAAGHLFQQLAMNLPRDIGRPDIKHGVYFKALV